MVPASRTEGGGSGTGTHLLSAKVRKTIQSIKEIVGNHSEADIYVALKETNMDPNETTQKLLNQDPFHEVKRRKDRKKENQNQNHVNQSVGNRGSGEPRRHSDNGGQRAQSHNPSEHNAGNRGSGEPRRHSDNGGQRAQSHNPSEHNAGNRGSGEPRRHSENVGQGQQSHKPSEHNAGYRGSGEARRHSDNGGQRAQSHNRSEHNVGNRDSGEPKRHTENGGQGPQSHNPSEHNVENKGSSEPRRHPEKGSGEPRRHPEKGSGEPRRHPENGGQGMHFHTPAEHRVRRTNYSRNPPSYSREFRVVRDNRVNHIYKEVKPPSQQHSPSTSDKLPANTSEKGSSAASTNRRSSGARNHQTLNGPSDSHARHSKDAATNASDKKITSDDKQGLLSNASARVQPIKPDNIHQNSSTVASTSSVVGVYSSSTDPVHVPSPDSRSSGVVGAIRREVGVVGVRRQSSDHKPKQLFPPSSSKANNSIVGKDGTSADSFQSVDTVQTTEPLSQPAVGIVTEPSFSGMSVSRPSLNNQYNSRAHQQLVGHQRVSQHNKEWKPKSSLKTNSNGPGVIGTPKKTVTSPAENSKNLESKSAQLQDQISQMSVYENQNVIIAQHIRVPETDRRRLTFGTIGVATELGSLMHQSQYQLIEATANLNGESATSLTVTASELSTDDVSGSKQVDLRDDHVRSSESESPASGAASEQQLPDNKESSSSQNLDNYSNIGLLRDTSPSYAPASQQDSHNMPSFSAYDPPTGYDIPYFRPNMDETGRAQVLSPPQEVMNSHHAANNVPTSTISMVQQQQQQHQVAQMYPQVHLSHYANLMPYRQFLSPVYVPPVAVPGYSNSAPYPHPTNGNSYLLMPGGGSHLNANGLKYGVQQFKPVPAGSPTGFQNFANPGYAMLAPGVVGGASGLEDSSRVKYKDNLYVPNPQAETSEIWLQNPRDLSGMQSPQYYNMPGQSPHAAPFMPSHAGHANFNAAAAQSSHMQFPGMYHTPPQQAPMPSPHHLGPAMGNNVGVAGAAPGAQVGAYQQPQLGHLNWTTNF